MKLFLLLLFFQAEKLDRGLIAVPQSATQNFLSWRLLNTDPATISFNIYRRSAGQLQKLSSQSVTNFTDTHADIHQAQTYQVRAVINGKEINTATYTIPANAPVQQYLTIPLKTPPGYTPNDASAADLDGDGQYEIILHQAGRARDNSHAGITDPPIFQAYKLDGTFLWEINLGRNIRDGAHYTQFMVYDLDGDGMAEFACKTADGTRDGVGKVIGDSTKDYRELDSTAKAYGRIITGPEYFTIFSGKTGAALATTDYIPARGEVGSWGDRYGNRVDRFLACVAYLDGKHPSVVMCRGYYGRIVMAAWDYRKGKLTSRWVFDTKDKASPYAGMGNHNLSVADVDNDGRDEIIYGSMCVDDDGKGLYTTGLGHGDAIHVGDLDPDRPGLEVFGIHELENGAKGTGAAMYDARTGEILFRGSIDQDVGRGVAENIDSSRRGAQLWWAGSKGLYDVKGNRIGEVPRSMNFLIWWDGDLSRELLDGNRIEKYGRGTVFTAEGCVANNGTKATPALSADLFGDWREELVMRTADDQSLRIYTTTIPTTHRIITLMQDHQYRMSIVWQNVGYNQPPHTGFYLGKF
jgi:rhamnogalacturonan endolyase